MTKKIIYRTLEIGHIVTLLEENKKGVLFGDTFIDLTDDIDLIMKDSIKLFAQRIENECTGETILYILSDNDLNRISVKGGLKNNGRDKRTK